MIIFKSDFQLLSSQFIKRELWCADGTVELLRLLSPKPEC
jgi:hypothetical protein